MLVGLDKLTEMLKFNGAEKWEIKRSEKSEPIFKLDGDYSNDEAIARFREVYNYLDPALYFLVCWSGNDKRGRQKTPFKKDGAGSVQSSHGINGVEIGNIDEIKDQAIKNYQKEQHYKELEEKVKRLEENENNFFFKLGTTLEPYLPDLMGAITQSLSGKPFMRGTATQHKKQNPIKQNTMAQDSNLTHEEIQEQASELFSMWIEKDPEALFLIQKIVTLIDNDPDTYKMAKGFLMK